MKNRRHELIVVALIVLFFVVLLGWKVVSSYNESRVYNRLTGAQTTTWDALWVQLRVQGAPR